MRKIEAQMNAAITASKNWAGGNTSVITEDGVSSVYLHGNLVAEVGDTWLRLFDGGYRSTTTKSRLNAILSAHGNGERVYQKNYNWFISLDNEEKEFESGILLN